MGRTKGALNKSTLERMVQNDMINHPRYVNTDVIEGIAVPSAWPIHEQLKAIEKTKSAVKNAPTVIDKPKSVETVREKMAAKMKKESEKIVKESPVKPKKKSEVLEKKPEEYRKIDKKTEPEEFRGVAVKNEPPRIPVCLVDGGMLYRWLYGIRNTYLEEKVDKKEIKIINEIMDYIMRMEKIEQV